MSIPVAHYWRLLSQYLRPQLGSVMLLFFLMLAGLALQIANPQLIARFIDRAIAGEETSGLMLLAVAFIVVAFTAQVLAVVATYFSETVAWTATNALRADLADHCLRLDMSFHKTRTPGEMIQRVDGDVDALSDFFSQFVLNLLGSLLLLGGVLLILTLEDWRLGLGTAAFSVVALTVLMRLRSIAVPHWMAVREKQARFYGFVAETLAGREDIRANGGRTHMMSLLRDHLREWMRLHIRSEVRAFAWIWIVSHGLFTAWTAAALFIAYLLWSSGGLSVGSAYLVFYYLELVRRPIDQIREQIQQLQAASASIVRVDTLFGIGNRLIDNPVRTLPGDPLSLEFDDVTFGYEADELVLQSVTFSLAPGEVLGLLGRTGSGKTTVGRLIVRLYDTDSGAIRLGGVPIRDVAIAELRSRVAVVSQDVQLFEGTLRDNLTFFGEGISDERLLAALQNLGLAAWLDSLPAGLETHVGPNTLSAGQAQLLACARAFLEEPSVVVLDEATSRLDPYTQTLIENAMSRLLAGRTAIIIAHRLSTIDHADRIAILHDGRMLEEGRRTDLLANPSSTFGRLRRMEGASRPA